MTQDINIHTCKWEVIYMDFITGLPHIRRHHDSIWVIVDRVSKFTHSLAVKSTNLVEYQNKHYIIRQGGFMGFLVYHLIQSSLVELLFLEIILESSCYSSKSQQQFIQIQTIKQSKFQSLEDILRSYMMNFKGIQDDHLPPIEFSYTNSYH